MMLELRNWTVGYGRNITEGEREQAGCGSEGWEKQSTELGAGIGENLDVEGEADQSWVSGLCNQMDCGAIHSSDIGCGTGIL